MGDVGVVVKILLKCTSEEKGVCWNSVTIVSSGGLL